MSPAFAPMGQRAVGTCSHCGGTVYAIEVWAGADPAPPPKCGSCGWEARRPVDALPVIPMQPPPRTTKEVQDLIDSLSKSADDRPARWWNVRAAGGAS